MLLTTERPIWEQVLEVIFADLQWELQTTCRLFIRQVLEL